MMTLYLSFVIILIFGVYYLLNNKIQNLKKEIEELRKRIPNHHTPEVSETKLQSSSELLHSTWAPDTEEVPASNILTAEITEPEKNRIAPLFEFLKQNALTVTGIFTLVLGIGYFVKYAIDKNWIGETLRTAIGFFTGTAIICLGYFLRKNYAAFSSIITAGGVAVFYFTATIAFREYHIFSQNTAFLITSLITVLAILLAYQYKSEILMAGSVLGGFSAPLMISTGESNYIFLFTYISLLNLGMLFTVFLRNWKSIGWIAFFCTAVYLFFWTAEKSELVSIIFYMVSYAVFYIFALKDYFKHHHLSKFDILIMIFVNFSATAGLVYIFNERGLMPTAMFPLLFALINGVGIIRGFQSKNFGKEYSVFAGICISLITLAFALEAKTHTLTSLWAVEASLLLFLWKKTGLHIFKIFFYAVFFLAMMSLLITWSYYYNSTVLTIVFNPVFLTSTAVAISCLFNLKMLQKNAETEENDSELFENIFRIFSFAIIYLSVLFEIIYQISNWDLTEITTLCILFTIFYLSVLIISSRKLKINRGFEITLFYLFIYTVILHTCGSQIISGILSKKIQPDFYAIHLLYLFPLLYIGWKNIKNPDYPGSAVFYRSVSVTVIFTVSFELYRIFIIYHAAEPSALATLTEHFLTLYLPVIWAVTASVFIYTGLSKNISELKKTGFALLGIMILKLYLYDVWQMDHISRISAFIILGVILLLSSFLFQRLKKIIKNLVDNKAPEPSSDDQTSNKTQY